MKFKTNFATIASGAVIGAALMLGGCAPAEPTTVITTPGKTTVVHDRPAPTAPNVTIVNPAPATSNHTETTTTTVEPTPSTTGGVPTTNTSTTTTGG